MPNSSEDNTTLNPRPFIRTFSYREVLSALMLVLMIFAFWTLLRYFEIYSSDFIRGLSVPIAMFLLHALYRLEHRRSNNFTGRVMHDFLFICLMQVISILSKWYDTGEFQIVIEDPLVILFALWIGLMLLEVVNGLLKRLFGLLKWRIL